MRRTAWLSAIPAATLLAALLGATLSRPSPSPQVLRFDGHRAFADLEAFVSKWGPRPSGSERSREVARWITARFRQNDIEARNSTGSVHPGEAVSNSIAMFPGASDRYIVVIGHHDTVAGAPGAEDNASSVAALLELARCLKGRPLRHAVLLCATDAEETGGAGAELLLADLGKDRIDRTDACIGLEMLAWPGGTPVLHAVPRNYTAEAKGYVPGIVPATIDAASPETVPLGDARMPLFAQGFTRTSRAMTGSDDVIFLKAGVPSLFLSRSSLSHFYPDYHKESDTVDKLSAGALQSSGRVLEAAVLALDEVPEPRKGTQEYLLWRTLLFPQRLLELVMIGPFLACAALAFWARGRDRFLSVAAACAALPCLSAALRFQPLVVLACWLPAAALPLAASAKSRRARLAILTAAALPAIVIALLYAAGAAMFGVRMDGSEAVSLLFSGTLALGGLAVASRGFRETPAAPPGE